jgi:hypothetical protein
MDDHIDRPDCEGDRPTGFLPPTVAKDRFALIEGRSLADYSLSLGDSNLNDLARARKLTDAEAAPRLNIHARFGHVIHPYTFRPSDGALAK